MRSFQTELRRSHNTQKQTSPHKMQVFEELFFLGAEELGLC